jgi:PhnB protein
MSFGSCGSLSLRMSITKLDPYLHFNGNAAKAIRHYENALGAKTEHVMRFSDVAEMNPAPEHKDLIMHALLRLGGGTLMISDSMPSAPMPTESNIHVCLNFDDLEDMTEKFEALAKDGSVTYPIHDTFWGAKFGMLIDAFGVRWMFNCDSKKS